MMGAWQNRRKIVKCYDR